MDFLALAYSYLGASKALIAAAPLLFVTLTYNISSLQWLVGRGIHRLVSSIKTIFLPHAGLSLRDAVETILSPIQLNPLIAGGHLQTTYVANGWTGKKGLIHYKRRTWQSTQSALPGHFTTDFAIPLPATLQPRVSTLPSRTHDFSESEWNQFIAADDPRPLVIILHGFLGGSHEKYIRDFIEQGLGYGRGTEQVKFDAVVINGRGCAYSKLSSHIPYHPRATWDLRQFVEWARQQWPQRKLYAVGFSIGANILCNYLGEEGDDCQFHAAVLIGNPWNLDISNTLLANSTIGLHVYQRALGTSFRKMFERHLDALSDVKAIDYDKARQSTFLWEWDRHVQCAIWGYPTEGSFYRDTSSVDAVLNIKVPTLALHAQDDPVCADLAVPYHSIELNPYVVMCATSIGGHLGWIENGGGRWSDRVVGKFLNLMSAETDVVLQDAKSSNGTTTEGLVNTVKKFDPVQHKLEWADL